MHARSTAPPITAKTAACRCDSTMHVPYESHTHTHASSQANDVFFALHAMILVTLTGLQALVYERGGQRLSTAGFVTGAAIVTATLAAAAVVVDHMPQSLAAPEPNSHSHLPWYSLLNWLYLLSGVKLAVTFFKYMPQVRVQRCAALCCVATQLHPSQVILNQKRRSTVGWNIYNVLLDIQGGVLSLVQQSMDAWLTRDWSALTGNPVKLFLALVSIGFDVVFIVQHYVLFPGSEDDDDEVVIVGSGGQQRWPQYAKLTSEDSER